MSPLNCNPCLRTGVTHVSGLYRYQTGGTSPKRVLVAIEQEHPWSSTTSNSNTHGQGAGDLPTSATSAPIPTTTTETPIDEATALANDLLGASFSGFLASLWSLMDVAEDEISAAMVRHPGHARLLWNCFQFLAPGILEHYDSRLYRSHV